jgi:hypothetical protein
VDIKYKRSNTDPQRDNIDLKEFLEGPTHLNASAGGEQKKQRVIFSNKGHTSIERFQSTQLSQQNIEPLKPAKIVKPKKPEPIIGWETNYNEEDLSLPSTQTFKKSMQVINN